MPGATTQNGIGPLSFTTTKPKTPPPSQDNHVNNHQVHREQSEREDTATENGEQLVNNPRGGVIGRTPTPPSAPTPVYEKDARYVCVVRILKSIIWETLCIVFIIFLVVRSARQIKRAILENEFLGNLEENQVEALVSAMYPKQIPVSTLVIREDDIGKPHY